MLGNVMLAVNSVMAGKPKADRLARAVHWLQVVGLKEQFHKYPAEISGGQKQRTGLARALAMGPELMLFDEPFGALGELTRAQLQDESLRLHLEEKLSLFMVTHSIDEAIYMSDRVVMMNNGPRASIGKILEIEFPVPAFAWMSSKTTFLPITARNACGSSSARPIKPRPRPIIPNQATAPSCH